MSSSALVARRSLADAALPIDQAGRLHETLAFFFHDAPKALMLLARSFFSPERTRAFLAGKREGLGNIAASSLGVGFVCAGVPLGVTFSPEPRGCP